MDFLPEDPDFLVFGIVVLIVAGVAFGFELRTQGRKRRERRRKARQLYEARQLQRLRNAKKKGQK
jgi:hypothetical protein